MYVKFLHIGKYFNKRCKFLGFYLYFCMPVVQTLYLDLQHQGNEFYGMTKL
ncbi:type III secretion translocase SctQ [Prevotella nigrescens ATCC 33563]|nr:type III secretion translocase SctQ [Prevotella nigrescens ATCC 33563]